MKIVYQAYGRADIVQQVLLSIVSLKSIAPQLPVTIEIYTDRKSDLEEFFGNEPNLKIIEFTPEQLTQWRGQIQFVHRVKLEILKLAAKSGDALVYLDGDTIFKLNPKDLFARISDGTSLMHIRESGLAEGRDLLTRKIAKFVKGKSFKTQTELLKIPPETEMWNAGVIGVSAANTKWFQAMIDMTDTLYAKYQKHVMEQLAVSYYLNRETSVIPAADVILHYWDQKPEFDSAIAKFLGAYPTFKQALVNFKNFPVPAPTPVKLPNPPGFFAKIRRVFERSQISK